MRRWMAFPLAVAVATGLIHHETPQASAQPKAGGVAESFRTADGVELHGLFHATTTNPSGAPVVVFLYPPGPDRDMTKGDWAGLAKMLNEAGYHVFQFDWRGHGKSTSIRDPQKFWGNPYINAKGANFNAIIKGGGMKAPLKNDLFFKDLGAKADRYLPVYLNDLAAVRFHLDAKNDKGGLNTGSIYLVGAGDAATLGMAWLTTEWNRPATMPNVNQLGFGVATYQVVPQDLIGGISSEAGADFGGAVWLTATRPPSVKPDLIKRWVSAPNMAPKMRDNNPMLFLYGEKDNMGPQSGKGQGSFFYNEVLVAEPKKGTQLAKLDQTFLREVKGAQKLQGMKLLGQNATLKTEDTIIQYFAAIQKVRQSIASKNRDFKEPYFVNPTSFGFSP